MPVADLDALQLGLISQHLVKVSALDLKRGGFAVAEGVAKIEGAVTVAPGKGRPVFKLETSGLNGVEHAGFFDEVDAVRQQTLANGETRKMLAFDDHDIVTFAFEQGGGNRTRWSCTNNHDLTMFHFYD